METTTAQQLIVAYHANYIAKYGSPSLGDPTSPVEQVFPHPVFKDVWGIITEDGWGYVIDGENVIEAPDTFDTSDPGFLEVQLRLFRGKLTMFYPEEFQDYADEDECDDIWEDVTRFTCYDKYDDNGAYAPSVFQENETVYPLIFIPNNPGGWIIYNKDKSVKEYWQA